MTHILHTGKGVDEYRDPVEPNSLSENFVAVFPEVPSLLNYHVERIVMLNDITKDKNKALEYKINETVKLHRAEKRIEEAVYTFQSVIKAKQHNYGPHLKTPLEENMNPPSTFNEE